MTRPLRIEFPGALYHLTARGNGRAAIFLDDFDRGVFLTLLGDLVEPSTWICHACYLMGDPQDTLAGFSLTEGTAVGYGQKQETKFSFRNVKRVLFPSSLV